MPGVGPSQRLKAYRAMPIPSLVAAASVRAGPSSYSICACLVACHLAAQPCVQAGNRTVTTHALLLLLIELTKRPTRQVFPVVMLRDPVERVVRALHRCLADTSKLILRCLQVVPTMRRETLPPGACTGASVPKKKPFSQRVFLFFFFVWVRCVNEQVSFANFLNMDQSTFEKHPERLSCNQQTSMINGVRGGALVKTPRPSMCFCVFWSPAPRLPLTSVRLLLVRARACQVPGCGGGCGAAVAPDASSLWDSYKQFPGSCRHNPKAALAEAKGRLDSLFYFVGVTEDFVGSMFLLQRAFGWGPRSVQGAFQKSMKAFCDGECKKRYRLKDVANATIKVCTRWGGWRWRERWLARPV